MTDAEFLCGYFNIALDWVAHWHRLVLGTNTQYFSSMEMLLHSVHARNLKFP